MLPPKQIMEAAGEVVIAALLFTKICCTALEVQPAAVTVFLYQVVALRAAGE